jgi:hypothetical protein
MKMCRHSIDAGCSGGADDQQWFGAPLVPEETIFEDNIRFPKKRTA